ncbi:hypothetical protein RVR_P1126 (plasmid) [Actinacidiphila reveromycinica]|uniref:PIN domain-containing protein n=1 Tax=Actinacidiphila reveromycinica TaxID=659352 RepID=A0A7U3QW44_9ACTN|nr:PIN domain-containing protein [Streptomyces sp. SN-593]BBG20740.1 hypothetical protein RVR_P1126 [Streptomyces sp. SN-593]
MSELVPRPRRSLFYRHPLRRALLDTSVLSTDVIAATRRKQPSSFEAGARAGTVRAFIPAHVWEEMPRVLADRKREGGKFDLDRALGIWFGRYAPVLFVVDTDSLPMTPEAEVLALEDPSDVGMLQLAAVIAPVVLIATDDDLLRSNLASADWIALRAALGKVGVTEGSMHDFEQASGFAINGLTAAVGGAVRLARANPVAAGAVAMAAGAGALYWRRRAAVLERPARSGPGAFMTVLAELGTRLGRIEGRHTQGEEVWQRAELGVPGDSLLHQVARTLAESPQPMTRTALLAVLEDPGNASHTARMAELRELLVGHPMFVDAGRGRWQIGRRGAEAPRPGTAQPDSERGTLP